MLKKLSLLVFMLTASTISGFAQVNEIKDVFVCKKIEDVVSKKIEISKIRRRVSYQDECILNVKSEKDWFSISVEKYTTIKESKEEFEFEFDSITLAEIYPENVQCVQKNKFWHSAKGYYKETDSDHLVMLRYKNIVVTLIGSNYFQLLKVKSLLKNAPFNKNVK